MSKLKAGEVAVVGHREGRPDPRRGRLRARAPGRALVPRRQDLHDLRGHLRDPATGDLPRHLRYVHPLTFRLHHRRKGPFPLPRTAIGRGPSAHPRTEGPSMDPLFLVSTLARRGMLEPRPRTASPPSSTRCAAGASASPVNCARPPPANPDRVAVIDEDARRDHLPAPAAARRTAHPVAARPARHQPRRPDRRAVPQPRRPDRGDARRHHARRGHRTGQHRALRRPARPRSPRSSSCALSSTTTSSPTGWPASPPR